MKKKYPVILGDTERDDLKRLIASGTAPARKLTHARILLKTDESAQGAGLVDEKVAEAVQTRQPTVARVREQYCCEGLQAALNRRPLRREYHRKLDGEQKAHLLLALACSEPPDLAWNRRDAVDEREQLGNVVAVPARQRDRQGQACRVHQQVVLGAYAGTVNRRGPGQPPLEEHGRGSSPLPRATSRSGRRRSGGGGTRGAAAPTPLRAATP
jgi:hypothetical protein